MSALPAVPAAVLAEAALRGALVLGAAFAALCMLRGASAAARHLALGFALSALLALPALTLALPAWRLPLLPVPSAPASALAAGEGSPARRAPAQQSGAAPARPPVPAGMLLLVLWAGGTAAVLVRLGAGVLRLRREAGAARPLDRGAAARARDRAVWRLGIDRPVRLLEGGADTMPLTWGMLRPSILLPAGTEGWPRERLEAVLTHELAHVRRGDCAWQLVAEAACALHWFNPMSWAAARRLRLEGEQACDDQVLMAGARGTDYAEHLLEVARTLRPPRHSGLAGVAMARPSQLRTRLGAVLSPHRRRGAVPRHAAAAALACAGALAALVAAAAPARAGGDAASLLAPATCSAVGPWLHEWDVVNGRGEWTVEWRDGAGCGGSAGIRGVRFAPDLGDVAGVAPGGFLRIELRDGARHTAAEVRRARSGVVKTLRVDGRRAPWNGAADAWLAAAIAELMRHTDYGKVDPAHRSGAG